MATGTINDLRHYGTIVLLLLDAEEGRTVPIPMDHRAFQHLLDAEACGPGDLIGRSVTFDGELVTFLE